MTAVDDSLNWDETQPLDPPRRTGPGSVEVRRMQAALESKLFRAAPAPVRVGRFTLIEPIGKGAMGIVYRAFDPDLDRSVALKLLTRPTPDQDTRMLKEARALARISHSHVVTVHEVGLHEGRLFLAMELVEGVSLERWSREHADGRRAFVARVERLLQQVAEGLFAAHRAGIVHRDVKPANILMGDDGRVRLADFGLARAEYSPSLRSSELESIEHAQGATREGDIVGTPAYMAPEQFDGVADVRSDQFGLCATFHELLHGTRPFPGDSVAAIVTRIDEGRPARGPGSASVPAYLDRILERGLSRDPADRFPDLGRMLEALAGGRRRIRRRQQLVAGTLTVAALAATWTMARGSDEGVCTGATEAIEGAWDPERRAALGERWRSSSAWHAESIWSRIAPQLDHYADAWVEQHTEVCEATSIRKEQSAAVMDARMRCLQRARLGLSVVVERLEAADREVVTRAHRLIEGLPPLDRCSDPSIGDRVPPDSRSEPIERRIVEAQVALEAGEYERPVQELERLAAQAEALEVPAVEAEIALALGGGLDLQGRYEEATAQLARAVRMGLAADRPRIARDAATRLVHVAGIRSMRLEAAQAWASTAWGLLDREPAPVDEARLRHILGNVARRHGDLETAIAEHRAALAAFERAGATWRLGSTRVALGHDLQTQGDYVGAEREHRRGLGLYQEHLGPEHPFVAGASTSLGLALKAQGRYAEAEAQHREALRIWSAALAPDHADIGLAHNNLGNALRSQQRYAEAQAEYESALGVYRAAYGSASPQVGGALMNLGITMLERGDLREAEPPMREALDLLQRALGSEHTRVVDARHNLGNALRLQGRFREAETQYQAALALVPSDPEIPRPMVPRLHASLGLLAQSEGRLDDAVEHLRVAVELAQRILDDESPSLAAKRYGLGMALLQRGDVAEAEAVLRTNLGAMQPRMALDDRLAAKVRVALAHARVLAVDGRTEATHLLAAARPGLEAEELPSDWSMLVGRAHAALVEAMLGWSVAADRAELRHSVEQARRRLDPLHTQAEPMRVLLDEWLAAHR